MLQGWIQITLTIAIFVAITPLLGGYMARIYLGKKTTLDPILNPVERLLYAISGVKAKEDMTGWQYARAILYSNLMMSLLIAFIQFNQAVLPFNPTGLSAPTWDTILHTTISFITNTNQQGNPVVNALLGSSQPNLEGKEVRFGWAQSALFATTTTGTMCGAVNALHDSFMPLGGFVLLSNLFLQIVWGGQGTGTAYLFAYLILAVFVTGLMVGRTPEFLGRKIEKREVVLASFLILLIHPIFILIPGAIAMAFPDQLAGMSNPGFHGLTQVIYEYASAAANNGSGFEGLADSQPAPTGLWWNLSASVSLLGGRYIPIVCLLLLADGMSRKQPVPMTAGTLRTDTGLFTGVTAGVILILGALTFFPVLALGPIAEAFNIAKGG